MSCFHERSTTQLELEAKNPARGNSKVPRPDESIHTRAQIGHPKSSRSIREATIVSTFAQKINRKCLTSFAKVSLQSFIGRFSTSGPFFCICLWDRHKKPHWTLYYPSQSFDLRIANRDMTNDHRRPASTIQSWSVFCLRKESRPRIAKCLGSTLF